MVKIGDVESDPSCLENFNYTPFESVTVISNGLDDDLVTTVSGIYVASNPFVQAD